MKLFQDFQIWVPKKLIALHHLLTEMNHDLMVCGIERQGLIERFRIFKGNQLKYFHEEDVFVNNDTKSLPCEDLYGNKEKPEAEIEGIPS